MTKNIVWCCLEKKRYFYAKCLFFLYSVLHLTAIHQQLDVIQTVITSREFNPICLDLPNKLCQTPLHLAVLTFQPTLVRLFLRYGASLEMRDKRGNTPLHIACEKGLYDCVRELTRPLVPDEVRDLHYPVPFHQIPQDQSIMNYDGRY